MLTGKIRGQIDQVWEMFWTGGVANPISVIEQISYLLFIRRLDEPPFTDDHSESAYGFFEEDKVVGLSVFVRSMLMQGLKGRLR